MSFGKFIGGWFMFDWLFGGRKKGTFSKNSGTVQSYDPSECGYNNMDNHPNGYSSCRDDSHAQQDFDDDMDDRLFDDGF